jgi:hypothetical protein
VARLMVAEQEAMTLVRPMAEAGRWVRGDGSSSRSRFAQQRL